MSRLARSHAYLMLFIPAVLLCGIATSHAQDGVIVITGRVKSLDGSPLTTERVNRLLGLSLRPADYVARFRISATPRGQSRPIATANTSFHPDTATYRIELRQGIDFSGTNRKLQVVMSMRGLESVNLQGLSIESQSIDVTMPKEEVQQCCGPPSMALATGLPCNGLIDSAYKAGDIAMVAESGAHLKVQNTIIASVAPRALIEVREVQGDWIWTSLSWDGQEIDGWVHRTSLMPAPMIPRVARP